VSHHLNLCRVVSRRVCNTHQRSVLSPSSASSHVSPKPVNANPNINPFAPLSPDLPENTPDDDDVNEEMNRILGVEQTMRLAMKTGPVVSYTTEELLRIAQKCQVEGWQVPRGMSRLESWFGYVR
jgi:hypothetical protein